MQELVPIALGLAVGYLLGLIRSRNRLMIGIVAAVLLGFSATVLTGEYRVGWEFLLIDIPLVGVSSVVALLASRHLAKRRRAVQQD